MTKCVLVCTVVSMMARSPMAWAEFVPPGVNLARGKSYTWNREPTYHLSYDPENDKTHLTDGAYVPGCDWTDKRTVGWYYGMIRGKPLTITLDLGEVEPIAGISYSTAAGGAGIAWPNSILVLTSNDGEAFYLAGDLTMLTLRHAPRPGAGAYRYVTDRLATRGRYVRLVVAATKYVFCDEIEIYRGEKRLLETPRPRGPFTDFAGYMAEHATTLGVQKSIFQDISLLRERLAASSLDTRAKSASFETLEELSDRVQTVKIDDPTAFRAILPMGDVHQQVYALNRHLLQVAGVRDVTVRVADRWAPLHPLDLPVPPDTARIDVRMMRAEYRAAAVNITNPTADELLVTMRVEPQPGAVPPTWIEPHEVIFMDSPLGRVLADALLPISPREDGTFGLLIPSGMTKQVWLRFAPRREIEPGPHLGQLLITAGADLHRVPVCIHISPVAFPAQPRLTQIWWDYTYGATGDLKVLGADSLHLAVRHLQDHFVDQTWAHVGASGRPWKADYYNDRNELVKPLDFSAFDAWVDQWDGKANYYAVFLSVKKKQGFCGKPFGTEGWRSRIAAWTAAWRKHVVEKGIDPDKICVLIMDEHSTDEQGAVILEWLKAIKAGFAEINTMATIMRKDAHKSAVQELYTKLDILIPNWSDYLPAPDYYAELQARGAKLWSYHNCPVDSAITGSTRGARGNAA